MYALNQPPTKVLPLISRKAINREFTVLVLNTQMMGEIKVANVVENMVFLTYQFDMTVK